MQVSMVAVCPLVTHSRLVPGLLARGGRLVTFRTGSQVARAQDERAMSVVNGLQARTAPPGRPRPRQLLITDVDNTLYEFGMYFEAGLEALVPTAASLLGISQDEVLNGLRSVYTERRSIEYPFALEEFPALRGRSEAERRRIVAETAAAFWQGAAAGLIPYPGVLATLQHLHRHGVHVVAFTDAPIHEALRRLRGLGADQYLAGLVATEWFGRRSRQTAVLRVADVPGFVRVPGRMSLVGRLSDDDRKPNPRTFARIAEAFHVPPQAVTVVGDSPARDLDPAAALGMRAVWARYGRRDPAREPLLQQVVPFRLPEITRRQDDAASPYLAIDRFDELLAVLPTQMVLPLRLV